MSSSNGDGVVRIGRKGLKKFAIGEGPVFEVDVVTAFQQWLNADEQFRTEDEGRIPGARMPEYHATAQEFVSSLGGGSVTVAEALDFLARLREQYDDLADFFRPKSREKRDSPATSEAESALQFSEET